MGKFININHTLAAIERIKKELSIFAKIIGVVSTIIFSIYYGYLIYENITLVPNLIAYIILFSVVIATFIIELVLSTKKNDSRKIKRMKLERKRFISIFIKSLKYLAKTITVGMALYLSLKNASSDLMIIMNFVSCGVLVITLLFEFIMIFVNRYIDYLKLGIELDVESSGLSKMVLKDDYKVKKYREKYYGLLGDSQYTTQENKIKMMLEKDAIKYKKEKEEKTNTEINEYKAKIREFNKSLTNQQILKITAQYENLLSKAKEIISDSNKIDELLIKAEKLIERLPKEVSEFKYIPIFVSLINNYVCNKYREIPVKSIISIIGAIIYFVSPYDVIPDIFPGGHIDDVFIINKCLDAVEDDLDEFILWRDKNQITC